MPPSSSRIPLIHEISFDHPGADKWGHTPRNFEQYTILKQETYYDFRAQPSYQQVHADGERWMKGFPKERLERSLALKDGKTSLEMCTRRLSQCDADDAKSDATLLLLEALNGRVGSTRPVADIPGPMQNVTPQVRNRAIGLTAWLYFNLYFLLPDMHSGTLYAATKYGSLCNAVCLANESVGYGHIPPIVIRVASWIMVLKAKYGVDLRKQGMLSEWRWPYLWKAYDEYLVLQRSKEAERLARISRAPNQYRCAADGCGIQVEHRKYLVKCRGNCPPETKPHYCSRDCQTRHWFIHQYVCKKGLPYDPVTEDDGDPDWVDIETYKPSCPDEAGLEFVAWDDTKDREIYIDIPYANRYHKGEMIRLRSRTLTPEFLRWYRSLWQLPDWERVKKFEQLLIIV